jgi:hypothetical protein
MDDLGVIVLLKRKVIVGRLLRGKKIPLLAG